MPISLRWVGEPPTNEESPLATNEGALGNTGHQYHTLAGRGRKPRLDQALYYLLNQGVDA